MVIWQVSIFSIHSLELDDFIVVAVDNSNNQIHPNALEEYKTVLQKGKPVILEITPFSSVNWERRLPEYSFISWEASVSGRII